MSFLLETNLFDTENIPFEETVYHNANGYLGVRGNFEEGESDGYAGVRGSYINAFYDTHPIEHPEKLYGFSETGERIVNVTDVQTIRPVINNEPVSLNVTNVENYHRYLDMKKGITGRSFFWTSKDGSQIKIETERLASFVYPELFYIRYHLTALSNLDVKLDSMVKGDVGNYFNIADPRVSGTEFKALDVVETEVSENRIRIQSRTKATGFRLWVQVDHNFHTSGELREGATPYKSSKDAGITWQVLLNEGQSIVLEKRAIFCDSRRHPKAWDQVEQIAGILSGSQFEDVALEQKNYLEHFWDDAGIEIDGDPHVLQGLRYNIYNLLQSAARDPVSSIPAKGLSGEGYEGHYFWDTEIYMFPFFLYTRPEIARMLLEYRYTILPGARRHARNMGHRRGAAYPWRTIAGRECSAYYPSGSAQYHINADIAYAVRCYWEATGDIDFLTRYGAEILFETARIWLEIGNYVDGVFHINTVTGPDEYTCLVNDNYYTNRMAQANLQTAFDVHELLKETHPGVLSDIQKRIDLDSDEADSWAKAAATITLLYDESRDINPQDSDFLQKPIWDFEGTPRENYPLLLHYHHMALSRHQVCKQADTLLAYILLDYDPPSSTIRNSYDYYEAITTHDSSLSRAAFSILAAQLGDSDKAYRYFEQIASVDLDDSHGNTKDGIHAANMGGTWLAAVWGFGGFRPRGDFVSFAPLLPEKWKSFMFNVKYRGSTIEVRIEKEQMRLKLCAGATIEVELYGKKYVLESDLWIRDMNR